MDNLPAKNAGRTVDRGQNSFLVIVHRLLLTTTPQGRDKLLSKKKLFFAETEAGAGFAVKD